MIKYLVCSLMFFLAVGCKAESADFLISLVRHGDRSPVRPIEPERWPMGAGQLTAEGTQQLYQLGVALRARYFDNSLPLVWRQGISYHRAKGIDRTVQSATALLQGFYPAHAVTTGLPQQIQIPPVYAPPIKLDHLFNVNRTCPGYARVWQEFENGEAWRQKQQQYGKQTLSRWAAVVGKPTLSIEALVYLYDNLNVYKKHGIPYPKGLTEQDVQQIFECFDWFIAQESQHHLMMQLVAAPFIEELLTVLRNLSTCLTKPNQSCERFRFYVASDSNLLPVLAVLGAPQTHNADYASHLDIQLNKRQGFWAVQLFLNNVPLSVKKGVQKCKLADWLPVLEKALPKDWQGLCTFGSDAAT